MDDNTSYIATHMATLLVVIVLLLVIWRYSAFLNRGKNSMVEVPEVKAKKNEVDVDRESDTDDDSETDMLRPVPRIRARRRTTIIRQPYPVGLPALPNTSTFLTQSELNLRYGDHLPFSNPAPPNGPAFAGGYGPPEVPAAGGLRA